MAYKYSGFWQCMDTFKDKQRLEELNQGARRGRSGTIWQVRAARKRREGCRPSA